MTDAEKKLSKKKTKKKAAKKKARRKAVSNKARRSKSSGTRKGGAGGKRFSLKTPSVSAVKRATWSGFKGLFWRTFLVCTALLLAYTVYLDVQIRGQFEGQKWALPAHVYTRPMELYVGQKYQPELIQAELDELGYVDSPDLERVGSYRMSAYELAIYQRAFRFWDSARPQQVIKITVSDQVISSIAVISSSGQRSETEIVRLEPRLFGSVSPLSHEDRSLIKLEDVPQPLIDGLIAKEDRQFYSHFGVNPLGIMRAMIRNLRAGRVVQGGSTLTQQLVKNYYLTSEVTYRRKFVELIMAVLLEFHYSKEEILQAYLNEVFMGQAGNRAIHGFCLASQYFYGRPLSEFHLSEIATLVAVNNGPSVYNPIRRPKLTLERRNLVLDTMLNQGKIDATQHSIAVKAELNISPTAARAATLSYPSFMGFVRENLLDGYQQDDLLSDGLQIYTTMNPRIQQSLELAVRDELKVIEKQRKIEAGSLQVAAMVVRTDNGEVVAMLGDRNPSFAGYNRALKARRPVGSLLKPFVFLTALELPDQYSLASKVKDEPITVSQKGSPDWRPQNYSGRPHGDVMMIDALANSYNLATVNLGMELGLASVADTVRRVGHDKPFGELPSMLLGAVPMSVMDVGQLYLTLASGGFKTPIKSIRSVLANDDQPIERYALDIEQVVQPEFTNLINYALQDVIRQGTGRSVLRGFKYDYGLAGKTGTTNDYRDSWFAGFSGNYLTVVWVGRDDNKSTGLTGASGAARVWAKTMQAMPLQRLELGYSEDVVSQDVYYSQDTAQGDCSLSRRIPMMTASLELENISCADRIEYDDDQNFDELQHFEPNEERQPSRRKKKSFWERIFG